jgi:hypothetical protein
MLPRPIRHTLLSLGVALATFAASTSPAGAAVDRPPVAVDAHHAALLQREHHPSPLAGIASGHDQPIPASPPASSSSRIDALPLALGIGGALLLAAAGTATVSVVRRRRSVGARF